MYSCGWGCLEKGGKMHTFNFIQIMYVFVILVDMNYDLYHPTYF